MHAWRPRVSLSRAQPGLPNTRGAVLAAAACVVMAHPRSCAGSSCGLRAHSKLRAGAQLTLTLGCPPSSSSFRKADGAVGPPAPSAHTTCVCVSHMVSCDSAGFHESKVTAAEQAATPPGRHNSVATCCTLQHGPAGANASKTDLQHPGTLAPAVQVGRP